ncbi:Desulfoferrodoxin [uncultured Eubacterium sp.]|nr:Desulfoferrodoxin [uncultured Eubacterium sp.]
MNYEKVGSVIYQLRKEAAMTQQELADKLFISNKAISKWERGQGCPDVSLLGSLSEVFGVNIEKILAGDLSPNSADGGNMKRAKFYVCPMCGNILTATGDAEISCCGRKLEPLVSKTADAEHQLHVEVIEDDYYITFEHEMSKDHFLNFFAYLDYDRVTLVRLYPEQGGEVRFPKRGRGKLLFGCSKDGLFSWKL